MDASRWRRIEALFNECRQLQAHEWEAYLESHCREDAVKAEVLSLLQSDSGFVDFLQTQTSILDGHQTRVGSSTEGVQYQGDRIGPYLLLEEIGHGGMGKVFLGVRTDGELEMKVAVKFSHPRTSPQFKTRFLRERQLLADLKHPHIAVLMDAGTTQDGRAYLIMEHIEGRHIDQWCADEQPSLTRLLGLFRKIGATVAFAHERGVIHRDLKPANLMVTSLGEPVLLDFGIAHLKASDQEVITGEHQRLLTPVYAAPEQLSGKRVTPAMDIYALGLILLDLLTGKGPKERVGTPAAMISDLILKGRGLNRLGGSAEGRSAETAVILESIPEALGHVLRTALEPDPLHRYQSAAEFTADLDRILANFAKEQTAQMQEPKCYDVLLWFHPEDHATATQLAQWLLDAKLELWFAPWSTVTDQDPGRELIHNLPNARTCLVLLGPNDRAPWCCDPAVRDALAFRSGETRVVPVLLPGAAFPERQSELPFFLRDLYWEPLPQGRPKALIERLRDEDVWVGPTPTGICPFRGLNVFREADRPWFFGREALIQRLARYSDEHRFTAVLGASGCGKSSVVQAGLIPQLRQAGHGLVLFTPTQSPFLELAHQLQRLLPESWVCEALFSRLTGSHQALHFLAKEWCAADQGERLYLVIDQFEELFTLARPRARPFLDALFFALDQAQGPVSVILTMRSDFISKCLLYPDLNRYLTENILQVEPMTRENLAMAITEPARLSGLTLEPGLLDWLLDDVTGAPAELPLLEYTLLELYQRGEGGRLTRSAYRGIGGIEGALVGRAESEYANLDEDEQHTLRKMFTLCLIHPGEGTEDTRRRASRDELLAVGSRPESVLRRWISARLLTVGSDMVDGRDMVDVAHEALIRKWDRIAAWMAEDRDKARRLERLRLAAQTWKTSGYNGDHLLRGVPLAQSRALLEEEQDNMDPLVRRFVAMGLRGEFRRKWLGFGLSGLGFLLAGIAILMYLQANQARRKALKVQAWAENERVKAVNQTHKANFHMGLSLEQAAFDALNAGQIDHAWLYGLAAVAKELPAEHELPRVLGLFAHTSLRNPERLLWRSTAAPQGRCMDLSADGSLLALEEAGDHTILIYNLNHGAVVARLNGHSDPLTTLAFCSDDKNIVSADTGGDMRLWRVEDNHIDYGTAHSVAKVHQGLIGPAVSPRGSVMASAMDQTIILHAFDPNTLVSVETRRFQLRDRPTHLIFSTDGTLLHTAESGGVVRSYRLDGTLIQEGEGHQDDVTVMFRHTDGTFITGAADRTLRRWKDGVELHTFQGSTDTIAAAAVVKDCLVSVAENGETLSWNLQTGQSRDHPFKDHLEEATTLLAHPLGVASLDSDGAFVLRNGTSGQPNLQFNGHTHMVEALAWSPDGLSIATSAADGVISLWDAATGRLITTLQHDHNPVPALAWSPDGTQLAALSMDGGICLWRPEGGVEPEVLPNWGRQINHLIFSPNGETLVTSGIEILQLWDLSEGRLLDEREIEFGPTPPLISPDGRTLYYADDNKVHTLDLEQNKLGSMILGHRQLIRRMSLSSDGRFLATASVDKAVRVWDTQTGSETSRLESHHDLINAVAFSPTGTDLVTSSRDGSVLLWDVIRGTQTKIHSGNPGWVVQAAFSPDGALVVTNSDQGVIGIWNKTGQKIADLPHTKKVLTFSFSPDSQYLATGSVDKVVRVWDVGSKQNISRITGDQDRISQITFTGDSQNLAAITSNSTVRLWNATTGVEAGMVRDDLEVPLYRFFSIFNGSHAFGVAEDQSIHVWNLATGRRVADFEGPGEVQALGYAKENDRIAFIYGDHGVRWWDAETGHTTRLSDLDVGRPIDVNFSPDGQRLAVTFTDHSIGILDIPSNRLLMTLPGGDYQVTRSEFALENTRLITADFENKIDLWDLTTGTKMTSLGKHSGFYYQMAFATSGNRFATPSADSKTRLWDTETGAFVAVLEGQSGNIDALSFSPDGKLLCSGATDKTLLIWDGLTGERLCTIQNTGDAIISCEFSPDGKRLATGSFFQTVQLWDMGSLKTVHGLQDDREAKRKLAGIAFDYFGYRLEGLQLKSEPASWLSAVNGHVFPVSHPLAGTRPRDVSLLNWLLEVSD